MANGLLDVLGNALGTTPPAYLEGLLGTQATEDLRKRSIGSGLVNALVGYAAMPKNQNLGLGRILAGAAQAGMQGAQGVYDTATKDYMTSQQIAEMKRKQDLARYQQTAIEKAATQFPQYADAIRANPDLLKDIIGSQINVEVDYKDAGDKLVPVNKKTGAPMANLQPIVKAQGVDYKDVGDKLVPLDKFTGKPIEGLSAIPKILTTSNTIDYDRYVADSKAAGKAPVDFNTWNLQTKRAGATSVNLPSESERTAGFLTSRLQTGLNQLNQVITKNPNAAAPKIGAEAVKFITGSDYLKNLANPESRQQIENAQLEILDAALTLGTGAAYTREQLQNYSKSYFPQLGDKPAAIKDKQDRLTALLKSANIKAGRAAPEDVGLPPNVVVERVK